VLIFICEALLAGEQLVHPVAPKMFRTQFGGIWTECTLFGHSVSPKLRAKSSFVHDGPDVDDAHECEREHSNASEISSGEVPQSLAELIGGLNFFDAEFCWSAAVLLD
jgi:hypothetical protein